MGSGEHLKEARVVPVDDLPGEDVDIAAGKEIGKSLEGSLRANSIERDIVQTSEDSAGHSRACRLVERGAEIQELSEEQWVNRFEELVVDLTEGPLQQRCHAAEEIRVLAKSNAKARSRIGDGGAIPALVELLRTALDVGEQIAQEMGALALLNVAISDDR